MKIFTLALLVAVLLPSMAQAHYLWIESNTNTDARVYFGEFNEGLRETAGGRLDERDTLHGWVESGTSRKELSLEKKTDHFAATLKDVNGWIVVEDIASEVKDWSMHDIGIVKPMYYARAAVGNPVEPAKPTLTLDILPVMDKQQSFQVYFKNKPLSSAKLSVHAPNLWSQELKTDEHGVLSITAPWAGRYVLEVIYKERIPGEYQAKPYQLIRHRTTYSFTR